MPGLESFLQLAFVRKHPQMLGFWSDFETSFLGKKIGGEIRNPIFICGLARSGTTLITHMLSMHRETGTFQYRDLPFIEVPYFWSFMNTLYYGNQTPVKREHGDELFIDPHSPDAFEELLWKNAITDYEKEGFSAVLDEHYSNPALEKTLSMAIRKILYTRGKKAHYLSKGNYNLFRLRYILRLFPDAKIILCVRNPFDHAHSLARVHAKFMELSNQDDNFAKRLSILGHFEFGPQRKAIRLPDCHEQQTLDHWERGEDYEGYLLQWSDVYAFAERFYRDIPNILWLDSRSMLTHKADTLRKLLQFCALPQEEIDTNKALDLVKGSTSYPTLPTPYDAEAERMYQSLLQLCR